MLYRYFFLFTLLAVIHTAHAQPVTAQKNYLETINKEATDYHPDKETIYKLQHLISQGSTDYSLLWQSDTSDISFVKVLQRKYPASYQFYNQLPSLLKRQVSMNYLKHFNIDKSRNEIVNFFRQK